MEGRQIYLFLIICPQSSAYMWPRRSQYRKVDKFKNRSKNPFNSWNSLIRIDIKWTFTIGSVVFSCFTCRVMREGQWIEKILISIFYKSRHPMLCHHRCVRSEVERNRFCTILILINVFSLKLTSSISIIDYVHKLFFFVH